jgi:hypothetical protein
MIQATASQIMTQFANNLKAQLAQQPPAAVSTSASASTPASAIPATPPPAAKPISGFSLMARVLWDRIARLFTRRPSP